MEKRFLAKNWRLPSPGLQAEDQVFCPKIEGPDTERVTNQRGAKQILGFREFLPIQGLQKELEGYTAYISKVTES